jgi:glucose-6-phosphate isomerase
MSSESLPFSVSLELALGGPGAVSRPAFDAALAQSQTALAWLREQYRIKSLDHLFVPSRTDDLAAAQSVADSFCKGSSDVAVLGIGGSSLGGQALKSLEAVGRTGPIRTAGRRPWPASI